MSPGASLFTARGPLTVLFFVVVLAFVSLIIVDFRTSSRRNVESARGSRATVSVLLEANSLRRRSSSVVVATSSAPTTSTQSIPTIDCKRWKCSCRGFSNLFGTLPGIQGRVPRGPDGSGRDSAELQWWQAHNCMTIPDMLAPEATKDPSVVSILSYSNGQSYCDENTLLNAM